jgi:hypothetical protein
MVSSFSATAAAAAAAIGQLGSDGQREEALQNYARLTEMVGRIIAGFDTLSVDQLRGQQAHGRGTTSRG